MARRNKHNPEALPVEAAAVAPLALPAELTIYSVGELHPQWLAWLGETATSDISVPATLQGAAVDQIDGAGLQLLLALQHSLKGQGRAVRWQGASDALRHAAAALGLTGALSLAEQPAAEVCA